MKLRLAIIGLGAQGKTYAKCILRGDVPNISLCAVYNRSRAGLQWAEENLAPSVERYSDLEQMLQTARVQAAIVCVPHFQHPEYVIRALRHGLHVLSEKPAGVTAKAVQEMNAAAQKAGTVYSVMWNLRADPMYRKIRQLLEEGVLGQILRVNWITTNWYRTQAYYDSSAWRATWSGEGGGILMNQCAHNLDMLCWLLGMPSAVHAFCRYGVRRSIDVENDVTAYLEYKNGAVGTFIASTYEFPGTNRLELSGENGKLVAEERKLLLYKSNVSESQFNRTNTDLYAEPEYTLEQVPFEESNREGYLDILENFADAILHGAALLSPGEEGLNEIRLCNAMQLSDWMERRVEPNAMDLELFERLLKEKQEAERKP